MENTKSEASKNDKKKAGPSNTNNTNSKSQLFHAGKLEALQADVAILQALLRRNRCNHGRTKYYQRLSMAITAIKRSKALDLYSNFQALKREILATAKRREVQRQRQLVFWEIQTTTANNNNTNNEERQSQSQMQKLTSIQESLEALPPILERLEFAAAALWVEMARGFFLPFCVTAVAAVARVRWLLRQAGLWILLPGESPSSSSSTEEDEWTIVERAWQKAHCYQQQETTLAETTSLWPRSQRNKLRDILHVSKSPSEMTAVSGPSSTTRTSTRLTLQRLGLEEMVADNNAAAKSVSGSATAATNDSMDDTNTSINDTTDNGNAQGEEEITKTMVGQNVVDHNDDDDDDTGVAVGGYAFMARAATGEDLLLSAAAMEQTLPQRGDGDDDDDDDGKNAHHQEFDQNMDLVKEFKKNRSTKQKKQKRGGGDDDDDDDNNEAQQKKQPRKRAALGSDPESIDKSSKKNKQKKKDSKKKQKGDFFDELFG